MSQVIYTDETVLKGTRYKNHKLCDVPVEYLLNVQARPKGFTDKALVAYVHNNLDRLLAKKNGVPFIKKETTRRPLCQKEVYVTKGDARRALKRIRESPSIDKKPIRSYECEWCSYWHLTSLPIEKWKEEEQALKKSKELRK